MLILYPGTVQNFLLGLIVCSVDYLGFSIKTIISTSDDTLFHYFF